MYTSEIMASGKSLMYTTNNTGPSTLLCGIPLVPGLLLYNNDRIQLSIELSLWNAHSDSTLALPLLALRYRC